MALARNEILILFDVDGTLTKARAEIEPEFEEFLYSKVKPRVTIGMCFLRKITQNIKLILFDFRNRWWK